MSARGGQQRDNKSRDKFSHELALVRLPLAPGSSAQGQTYKSLLPVDGLGQLDVLRQVRGAQVLLDQYERRLIMKQQLRCVLGA